MSAPQPQHDPRPVVLRLRAVAFGYHGTAAVQGLDFELHAGEAIAVLGPNGAGKTTLLAGLLGLVDRLGGAVEHGESPPERPARLGWLPQRLDVDPEFPVTVRQVVLMGRLPLLPWWRPPGRADRAAVGRALERVGLAELAGRRFGELSGGQRQRVLLARAIVGEPTVLLLDEPFNGLDEQSRETLLGILRGLTAEGVAVLVSTHDLSLAVAVCERALLLDGRQLELVPVDALDAPALTAAGFALPGGQAGHHHD